MFKRLIIIIALMIGLNQAIAPVYACSGFPHFGVSDLHTAPILAKVRVIEADDRGYSAILGVYEYYKGQGEQYLTVMRHPPALQSAHGVRGYDTGCLYSGYGARLHEGDELYIGLEPNGNGTYTDYIWGTAHFHVLDGVIPYQEGNTEGYYAELDGAETISEEDFVTLMLNIGERDEPLVPIENDYPRKRFLNILTDDGTLYRLNPDNSMTEIGDSSLIARSPDGAHVALRSDEDHIWLTPSFGGYGYDPNRTIEEVEEANKVPGTAAHFSNNSHYAAVWNDEHLSIYVMGSHQGFENYGYGMKFVTRQLVQIELETPILDFIWSADSSTLVWETPDAFYYWNIRTMDAPQQIPVEKLEDRTALYDVTAYGNYVTIRFDDLWVVYDVQNNWTTDDRLISFREDATFSLLARDTDTDYQWDSCTIPLAENCLTQPIAPFQSQYQLSPPLYLTTKDSMIWYGCHSEDNCYMQSYALNRFMTDVINQYGRGTTGFYPITDLTYDRSYGYLASTDNETNLYLGRQRALPLDLADDLDSAIAHIGWGQPTFYTSRVMQNTIDLPNQYMPR